MTDDDAEVEPITFEERADQVDDATLRTGTVAEDHFDEVHKALVAKGLVLIEGPRGCGKTHLMRYTALRCRDNEEFPLAIYVSFNRYLRLEPLLQSKADAVITFQSWVLGNIVIEANRLATQLGTEAFDAAGFIGTDQETLRRLIDRLERRMEPTDVDVAAMEALTIGAVTSAILAMCDHYGRPRAVVLLDDAALTLTPEYMVELFDIVRVLKHPRISPKASVYPGTTEYGPRFHPNHEGRTISAWLPVEDGKYLQTMREIATKRYSAVQQVPSDINDLFVYASFGIPRAYLTMLRSYVEKQTATSQQAINAIVQDHNRLRLAEFESLALKVARLETLVRTGRVLIDRAVDVVRIANDELNASEKQIVVGIETGGLTPIVNRMINLVIEAGLLYEHKTVVSHGGGDRTYRRFTPHIAGLLAVRAFSGRSRGSSPKSIVDTLRKPSAKHPVRRKIDTLVPPETIRSLRFNLPPCEKCQARRLSETQLFCHNCGARLIQPSTYDACMRTGIGVVPALTPWQVDRLVASNIRTVADFLAIQDPGTELRKIWQVGRKRAASMADAINNYVDEYLS